MKLPKQTAGCIRYTAAQSSYISAVNPAWVPTLIKAAGRILSGILAGVITARRSK